MLMGRSIVKPEVFNLDVHCFRVDAEGSDHKLKYLYTRRHTCDRAGA
jgi:hypothetical protein